MRTEEDFPTIDASLSPETLSVEDLELLFSLVEGLDLKEGTDKIALTSGLKAVLTLPGIWGIGQMEASGGLAKPHFVLKREESGFVWRNLKTINGVDPWSIGTFPLPGEIRLCPAMFNKAKEMIVIRSASGPLERRALCVAKGKEGGAYICSPGGVKPIERAGNLRYLGEVLTTGYKDRTFDYLISPDKDQFQRAARLIVYQPTLAELLLTLRSC